MLYNFFLRKINLFFIKSGFLVDFFYKFFINLIYNNFFIFSCFFFFEKYILDILVKFSWSFFLFSHKNDQKIFLIKKLTTSVTLIFINFFFIYMIY